MLSDLRVYREKQSKNLILGFSSFLDVPCFQLFFAPIDFILGNNRKRGNNQTLIKILGVQKATVTQKNKKFPLWKVSYCQRWSSKTSRLNSGKQIYKRQLQSYCHMVLNDWNHKEHFLWSAQRERKRKENKHNIQSRNREEAQPCMKLLWNHQWNTPYSSEYTGSSSWDMTREAL